MIHNQRSKLWPFNYFFYFLGIRIRNKNRKSEEEKKRIIRLETILDYMESKLGI